MFTTRGWRDLSRLYLHGRFYFNSKWLPRLSCVNFPGASLWFLDENTGFQYRKSKEQLLRNTRLLKQRKSVSSQPRNSCSRLCQSETMMCDRTSSQTRSANHHTSCRLSRKFLCAPGNPLYKTLQVWMWILPSFLLSWLICHISNSFSEIFEKRAQFHIEARNCAFGLAVHLNRSPSRSFTQGQNWTNLLFRSVWINFLILYLILFLKSCCLCVSCDHNFTGYLQHAILRKPWDLSVVVYVNKPISFSTYQIRPYDNTIKLRCRVLKILNMCDAASFRFCVNMYKSSTTLPSGVII